MRPYLGEMEMPMTADPRVAEQIEAQLRGKAPQLQEVVRGLRALVREAVPGVTESLSPWDMPTFESNGPMCYFSVAAKQVTSASCEGHPWTTPRGCWRARARICAT